MDNCIPFAMFAMWFSVVFVQFVDKLRLPLFFAFISVLNLFGEEASMSFIPIEARQRTMGFRIRRLATGSLLLFGLFGFLMTISGRPSRHDFELFPKHFKLRPGERIHYNVCPSEAVERYLKGKLPRRELHCVDAKFSTEDPNILRLIPERTIKNGEETSVDGVLEAVQPGRTNLVVSTPNLEERFTITVAGAALPSFKSVPHTAVKEIKAKEFVFVGHADLDGFDFTAVAKHGIDRVVAEARKNRVPVVYWVSNEYPNWYTSDRQPDYAFVSEGQEHEIYVDSERVTFTGGSFMMCVLRNVQMTLHGRLKHDAQRVHFVFPAEAIWVEDLDRGDKRWYPTPAVLLSSLFVRRQSDTRRYEEIVVPFLDHLINEFPVVRYPRNPPTPSLTELLKDWNILVRFGERFERFYRRADSNKILLVEFLGV